MRISATYFALVFWAISLVSAALLERRNIVEMMRKMSSPRPAGAAYVITNEPQENMVITASIEGDGTVRRDRAIAAGGRGPHGVTANGNTGVDGLFSQGAIQVSTKSNVLATANPGSSTVSLFSIDPRRPTNISHLGDPTSSEGEFPASLAFNADGSRLCVLIGGAVNGVKQEARPDPIPNSLRYLGFNQTTPANGPPNSVSQIIFSEDGSKLLVSYKGPGTAPGYLASWDVQKDGSLSARHTQGPLPSGGMLAFSLTPIPKENVFFVTDPGIGFDIVDLGGKRRSAAGTINGQMATCWSAHIAKTGSYCAIDTHSVPAKTSPIDSQVGTVGGKDHLYVLDANSTSVDILAQTAAGQARQISKVDISGRARAVGIPLHAANIQGMSTYVAQ
ncbi:hypothetical protein BN946_scf184908.g34 [Trametes cinnabarina]|uniref:3-carboxymuconate cyclase n=1 Tax=Pycnoporus cinnabarinus TaxID=5643 RepID=A0A060S9X1_PYCCI|nr:hypothetical protein BN946_scf184908.g34 [Trametes cinnabarina]